MRISDWSADVGSSDLHVEFSGANCGFGDLQVGVTACSAATPPIEQRQAQPQRRACVHAAVVFTLALRADIGVGEYACVAGEPVTVRAGRSEGRSAGKKGLVRVALCGRRDTKKK